MPLMQRRSLPLSALRAFEAAARLGSFKAAAEELAVTPTAVSHQIRALEAQAGLALFERQVRLLKDRVVPVFLAAGGKDEGAPGLRPFHPNFYACYVRDPDGNKLSALCEKPE